MDKLDKSAQKVLKRIYTLFENESELSVSSPDYKKPLIDYLIRQRLLEKIDVSTFSGWEYLISPTHEGELVVIEISNLPSSKVEAFIEQGEAIMKEEYHHVTEPGLAISDYISGPKSDQWFSEISIFNSRFLKEHPLHDQIAEVCRKHKRLLSPHEDMMSYLKALDSDDEFWKGVESNEKTMPMRSRKTIDQLLAEDIDRCEHFLHDPTDEAAGLQLY